MGAGPVVGSAWPTAVQLVAEGQLTLAKDAPESEGGSGRVDVAPHCPFVSEVTLGSESPPTTVQSMRSEQLIATPYPDTVAGGPKVVTGPVAPATPAIGMITTVPTKRMAAPTANK